MEVPFPDAENIEEWLELTTFPLKNDKGEITGAIEYVKDITERKEAEKTLRFTKFSVDHTSEAAFWAGSDAKFFYVNDAVCRLLGYNREELLKMSVLDINNCFTEEIWADHWKEIKEKKTFSFETNVLAKDSRVIPMEITVNYVEFENKEYNCAFGHDITERKQAEQALREVQCNYKQKFNSGL